MSKPKIVVLHMRELIYTAIFIFLILVLLILLFSDVPATMHQIHRIQKQNNVFFFPLMQIPSDISPESIRLP